MSWFRREKKAPDAGRPADARPDPAPAVEMPPNPAPSVETLPNPTQQAATSPASPSAVSAEPALSLRELARHSPGLAGRFLWSTNDAPPAPTPFFLHLGCGSNVIEGFVNVDFLPHDARVHAFELLDHWPDAWQGCAQGVFAEDTLEHFFHGEQAYILCNVNRVLRQGGVARILMPSYPRLAAYGNSFRPVATDVMHAGFGVDTGADAVNMGMRFSGHRWLHSEESLAALADMCGFAAEPTTCSASSVPQFNGINLRNEEDSLSFAADLRKLRPMRRIRLDPVAVVNASKVEDFPDGAALFRSDAARPMVVYTLPEPVAATACACINVRSANLSSFHEHNQKWLVLDEQRRDDQWHYDETLKSRPCMNIVTRNQLGLLLAGATSFSRLVFSPAAGAGEYFTLGCAEVYLQQTHGEAAMPIV